MKRNIIICGLFYYPHGNATANYIQYLADALQSAGYNVTILSYINKDYTQESSFIYKGAKVIDIENHSSINIFQRLMNGKLFQFRLFIRLLKLNIKKKDLVIPSNGYMISNPAYILRLLKKYKICGLPLEWFPLENYKSKKRKNQVIKERKRFSEYDLMFPISHYIENELKRIGTDAYVKVLPIMADCYDVQFQKKEKDKYSFVFPANGAMKDALSEMLLGISNLSDPDLKKIIFHITGVKEQTAINILGETKWKRIKDVMVFHDWMKYEDLIELYQNSHYLFLAREVNQTTLANFPSKVPEVMTYGVVPVVSRVGDYTSYYLTDSVDSIIFNGCDADTCSKSLHKAINLPYEDYLQLSINARKCVENKFDYHNWITTIKKSVESIF